MKKTVFSAFLLFVFILNGLAATPASDPEKAKMDSVRLLRKSREVRIDGKISMLDVNTPAGEVEKLLFLSKKHPAQDSVPPEIFEQVAERTRHIAKDSLSGSDLLWVLRPYLLWLQNIDPHLRASLQPRLTSYTKKSMKEADNLPLPGFLLLNVDDTLVVSRSVDPLFERGDRILAVNGTPAAEYLQYCYDDRTIYPFTLFVNHRLELVTAADYTVLLERKGQKLEVTTPGIPWPKVYLGLCKQYEFYTQIFPEEKAGYFAITKFYPNNSLLINKLRKAIVQAKKQGCNSFILDLRGNPGGNGGAFDKLLSIFIDKPSIPYMKSQQLRVSKATLHDYDFLTDSMLGQKVAMPEKEIVKEVTLDKKMYVPGMRYYVLMNKDTGSVAATFCNILQYNGAAELVGEPLLRNALKYGEVLDSSWLCATSLMISVSSMEFDEYTEAVDGVVTPDIAIPYAAADYLSGEDAMLDKLLKIISAQ